MSFELIVIGASAGGTDALGVVLAALPAGFPVPLAVVLHRGKETGSILSQVLQARSAAPVSDAEDKQAIVAGRVYLAPADYHLLVEGRHFALSVDAPVSYARPSVDVLFESAADAYGPKLLAVILTGANGDGARGAAAVAAHNREMPDAALAAVGVSRAVPLDQVGPCLIALCATLQE